MEYMGMHDVMKTFNIKTRVTIYRWITSGKFLKPYIGKSGHYLWKKSDVEAWKQEKARSGIIYL